METEQLFVMVVMFAIVAGVVIVVMGLRQRAHQLELTHRERMAMIERGLVPPPEMEGSLSAASPQMLPRFHEQRRGAASRSQMTFGIVLIGAGLAFMTVIGIAAGSPDVAIGLGGAAVIFGVAMIVISQVVRQTVVAHIPPVPRTPDHPE